MIHYNPKGLTAKEVEKSRAEHGNNIITPPKDDSAWKLLLEKFQDPIIRILLLAAVLSLAIGFVHRDFTESIGIVCAIILATCVGFWFEWDAQRRFRRLNQVNDDISVKVMREGSIREIPRRDVVVGDVVYIEGGETVPADGELVEAVSLKINESTLTGEPEVDKTVDPAHFDPEATYPSNVAMRGTTVADGYGVLVVTAVGDATEAGRVTEQSTVQSEEQTPLDRQLTRLSKLIGRVGILLSVLIFCVMLAKAVFVGGLLDQDWLSISQQVLNIFMVSVAIIVMAVPEGLPMSDHPLAGHVHAPDAQDQQPRAQDARLRDHGRRDGHLHRQDRNPHPEPDARPGTRPLRRASRPRLRRGRRAQLHGLPRCRRADHRKPHRRGSARMDAARRKRLRGVACRSEDRRPSDLLHRTQVHGHDHRKRDFGTPPALREGCAGDRARDVRTGRAR